MFVFFSLFRSFFSQTRQTSYIIHVFFSIRCYMRLMIYAVVEITSFRSALWTVQVLSHLVACEQFFHIYIFIQVSRKHFSLHWERQWRMTLTVFTSDVDAHFFFFFFGGGGKCHWIECAYNIIACSVEKIVLRRSRISHFRWSKSWRFFNRIHNMYTLSVLRLHFSTRHRKSPNPI